MVGHNKKKKTDSNSKIVEMGYTYGDVLLIPGLSETLPADIDISTKLTDRITLNSPFISSDMDTVTGSHMAIAMPKNGGVGFVYKDKEIKIQAKIIDEVKYHLMGINYNPVTINKNDTYESVRQILDKYKNRFSTLVVTNNSGKVVGLVTRDKSKFANLDDKVKSFMNKDILTSEKDMNVKEAYKFMKNNKTPKLVLVNKKGKLKGFYTWKDVESIVENINPRYVRDNQGRLIVGANVGIHDYKRVETMLKKGCDILLVGSAHGHSKNVIDTVEEINRNFRNKYDFDIIAGNVATYEGAKALGKAGASAIKVGVGPGSICTTRIVAGAGVPQVKAIMDASAYGLPTIADGGIVYSGDCSKAVGAGASAIMMGSVLARTYESAGEKFVKDGIAYKFYRGMGSESAMKDMGATRYGGKDDTSTKTVPEGIESVVPLSESVEDVLYKMEGGLRQGMGYVGARNMKEMQEKARFVPISNAGVKESHVHDVIQIKDAPNYTRRE